MTETLSIFHPGHYEQVRRPALEASPLPAWCYTSQEFYEREVARIFMTSWNFVGRADLIPEPGCYQTLDFVGVPVILLRDSQGTIRAFSNSCRHRGSRLLSADGKCDVIVCPYHSWTYSLEGDLVAAAGMEKTLNFERHVHGLVPIRCETWQGFIFINFADTPDPLLDYLGDLPEHLGSYNFADMQCTRLKVYDVACNWKTYIENQREGYHVRTVHHKSLFGPRFGASASYKASPVRQLATRGNWIAAHFPHEGTEGVRRGETTPFPRIPSLVGHAAEGTYFALIFPHTFFGCTTDCMWWMECRPEGPLRTRVVVGSCFPKGTIERRDFEQVVEKYYARWDTSHPEDNEACTRQQEGLGSPFAKLGRFSYLETGVHQIANWVLDRVLDPTT